MLAIEIEVEQAPVVSIAEGARVDGCEALGVALHPGRQDGLPRSRRGVGERGLRRLVGARDERVVARERLGLLLGLE